MNKTCYSFVMFLLVLFSQVTIRAQAVFVDSNTGNDNNDGTMVAPVFSIQKAVEIIKSADNNIYTMKINPGIYVLEKHVSISTAKDMTQKRLVIEAAILPGDSAWTPEKMPVIISAAKKGELPEFYNFVAAFLINENHVTIRGIKFHGYFYPNTRFFPIARFNKAKTDLLVEQCMFVGDKDACHIQVGIIAHGDGIKINHCVFYNAKNAVVYWQDTGSGGKTGNSFTNNVVYGAFQTAIWTAWPDNDFLFENNIITRCKHAWIANSFNKTKYSLNNSIIVNNQYYQGVADESGVHPREFEVNENNIIKEGEIILRLPAENVDEPLPIDYLHIVPGSLGYEIGAGLFKQKNQYQ
jgi:hypothetical protein